MMQLTLTMSIIGVKIPYLTAKLSKTPLEGLFYIAFRAVLFRFTT